MKQAFEEKKKEKILEMQPREYITRLSRDSYPNTQTGRSTTFETNRTIFLNAFKKKIQKKKKKKKKPNIYYKNSKRREKKKQLHSFRI